MKSERKGTGIVEIVLLALAVLKILGLLDGYSILQVILIGVFLAGLLISAIIIWFLWR